MKFIILEKNSTDMEFLVGELKKSFPLSTIYEFRAVGDFISSIREFPKVDVIITEKFLPLIMEEKPDHDEWLGNLERLFPEVTIDWDYQKAGEGLVRYIRKVGIKTPVIIYTYSDKRHIKADILEDDMKVVHCIKDISIDNLIKCIRNFLAD